MILTDGALSDYEEAFNNGTKLWVPEPAEGEDPKTIRSYPNMGSDDGEKIRIFTYLIGKDLKNSAPLKQMACNRRGYFSHIGIVILSSFKVTFLIEKVARHRI